MRSLQNSSLKGVLFFLEEDIYFIAQEKKKDKFYKFFQAQNNGYFNYYSFSIYVPVTMLGIKKLYSVI